MFQKNNSESKTCFRKPKSVDYHKHAKLHHHWVGYYPDSNQRTDAKIQINMVDIHKEMLTLEAQPWAPTQIK